MVNDGRAFKRFAKTHRGRSALRADRPVIFTITEIETEIERVPGHGCVFLRYRRFLSNESFA